MKKTFFGLNKLWVAGALLLLLTFAFPALKGNAALSASDVHINYHEEIITVPKRDSTGLQYAIVKKGTEPKTYVPVMDGASDIIQYAEGKLDSYYIDISGVNFKNPMTIFLKYDSDTEPVKVDLGIMKDLKVSYIGKTNETNKEAVEAFYSRLSKFNSETGYLLFALDGTLSDDPLSVEWNTARGMSYHMLSELNLGIYQVNGATLYFRVNNFSDPTSKVAKLKIKKIAKAPAVKIDGNKMNFSIKGNMEYRVVFDDYSIGWTQPDNKAKVTAIKDMCLDGDGYYKSFSTVTVEVRVAATEKAIASRITSIPLYAVQEPASGKESISVNYVDVNKPEKGLKVTNVSKDTYQVAIVPKGAWNTTSSSQLIKKIDGNAKKTEEGYVEWVTVKGEKSVNISQKKYKDFAEYYILYRRASVPEDKKTAETEFRVASVIKVLGGSTPKADIASGAILVNKNETVTKTVRFDVEQGLTLYTSVDDAAFAVNSAKSLTFTRSDGDSITIKAYTVNPENNDKSDIVSWTYRFISGGELDCYKDKWGYNLLKRKDAEDGTNGRQLLYQRVYQACLLYETSVNYGDLGIDKNAMIEAVYYARIDNPELIQAESGFSYTASTVNLHLRNKDLCDRLLAQCNANVEEIKEQIKEKYGNSPTKVQMAKVAHDYLVLKKEYKDSDLAQTMAGSLSDEYTPVCMSYALAFKYVCNALGIQCEMVFGDATNSKGKTEAHAWNMINYGENVDYSDPEADYHANTWYEVDVTWDDPSGTTEDYVRWDYFNLTTDQINKSRVRTNAYYTVYPLEKCTGTALSYSNCMANHLLDEIH